MTGQARPAIPAGPYLVVGLARSGASAMRALARRGHQVAGVDLGSPHQAVELAVEGFDVHTSSDGLGLLESARCVVKSPGVPAQSLVIEAARERGIPVIGELELGWRMLPRRFVAITGTNGKTTTTELLGEIFRHGGLTVAMAGNVGTAVCEWANIELAEDAVVVCEASSFQLEDSMDFAPECAVLLNLSPDHINRHGSFERYRDSKLKVFANQSEEDHAIAGPGVADLAFPGAAIRIDCTVGTERGQMRFADGKLIWHGRTLIARDQIRLRGPHNAENAMVAAAAALTMGVSREAVVAGLGSFAGVRHRLQEVATIDGVLYINDSKATNVDAACVGIESFDGGVHAILGGSLKGGGFGRLASSVAEKCRRVYLIGEAASQIRADLRSVGVDTGAVEIVNAGDLEKAIELAYAAAEVGDIVLLSPACASFDQFRDYEHRGECFIEVVRGLAAR